MPATRNDVGSVDAGTARPADAAADIPDRSAPGDPVVTERDGRSMERFRVLSEVSSALAESTASWRDFVHDVARIVGAALGATVVVRFIDPTETLNAGSGWYPGGGDEAESLAALAATTMRSPNTELVLQLAGPRWVEGLEGIVQLIPPEYGPLAERLQLVGATFLGLRARERVSGLMVVGLNAFATPEQAATIRDGELLELIGKQVALAADNAALLGSARTQLLGHQRADAVLVASEARFHSAFRVSPAGMLLLDRSGRISEVNDAATRLIGRDEDDILGVPFASVLTERSAVSAVRALARLRSGELHIQELELDYLGSGGARGRGALTTISRAGERERSYAFVVHSVDITVQRLATEENHALNELLLRRLEELTEARGQLASALAEVAALRESDRRQLSTTLHENTLQTLLAAAWAFDALSDQLRDPSALQPVRGLLNEAISSLQSISWSLLPPALSGAGLAAAIEQQAQSLAALSGAEVSVQAEHLPRFDPVREALAFRVAAEALEAARTYEGLQFVFVTASAGDGVLRLRVAHDGDLPGEAVLRSGLDADSTRLAMHEMLSPIGAVLRHGPDGSELDLPMLGSTFPT